MRRHLSLPLVFLLLAGLAVRLSAGEVIPPAPEHYFNDYTGIVAATTADTLDHRLEQFERDTSNQIVVAIFPRMESASSIEDYTVRVAQAWRVGQKATNNGAVLFVFKENRTLYIQVGYGLEGVLPDALCKRIIDDEIVPHFRNGDFAGGVEAGVDALLAATKGEYRGTGRTTGNPGDLAHVAGGVTFLLLVLGFAYWMRTFRGTVVGSGGRSTYWSSGYSGGGWSGGGGGGFSGGGGSFGGGGAGGHW